MASSCSATHLQCHPNKVAKDICEESMCDVRGVQLPAQPSNGHEADDWHQDQVHPVVDCAQAQEEKKGGDKG